MSKRSQPSRSNSRIVQKSPKARTPHFDQYEQTQLDQMFNPHPTAQESRVLPERRFESSLERPGADDSESNQNPPGYKSVNPGRAVQRELRGETKGSYSNWTRTTPPLKEKK